MLLWARNRDRMIPFNPTLGTFCGSMAVFTGFCDGCIRVKVLPLQTLIDRFGVNTRLGYAKACPRFTTKYVPQEADGRAKNGPVWKSGYLLPGYCVRKR